MDNEPSSLNFDFTNENSKNDLSNKQDVLYKDIIFPTNWSGNFKDFMSCLLERNQDHRARRPVKVHHRPAGPDRSNRLHHYQ